MHTCVQSCSLSKVYDGDICEILEKSTVSAGLESSDQLFAMFHTQESGDSYAICSTDGMSPLLDMDYIVWVLINNVSFFPCRQ